MTEEDFLFRIKQHYLDRLPFVVHNSASRPGLIEALLQKEDELHTTKDFTESGFVFAPFDDEKEAVLIPENISERISLKHLEFPAYKSKEGNRKREFPDQGKEGHIRLVEKAIGQLQSGKFDKVVLSRREEIELENEDPVELFEALLHTYPGAFVYCWYHPKVGTWLGATPETLLKVSGNQFETMALAGTQKFNGDPDPEWGQKEIQEQQYVTDSILENLQRNDVRSIQTEGPYTSKAGNLLHLRTDIRGSLNMDSRKNPLQGISRASSQNTNTNDKQVSDVSTGNIQNIISALHPTPAVSGLPKERAKEFILDNEGYDREFYTGFLGELNRQQVTRRSRTGRNVENLAYRAVRKETSLFVNLRCMKLQEGKAVLFIGGGITRDSVPEDEWQETVSKSQTMKKVLV